MKTLKDRLILYLDSGFPILYLETFEEEKAETLVREVAGISPDDQRGREVVEWNVHGLFFRRRKKRDKVGLAESLSVFQDSVSAVQSIPKSLGIYSGVLHH